MTVELREARHDSGLSARDLAALVDVHPTTVHRWERHERRPAPAVVNRLAASLDADRDDLVATLIPTTSAAAPVTHRGTGLRLLRHDHGVSVSQIATAARVPTHTVYNWEAGRSRLTDQHVAALATLFALPRHELVAGLARPAPRRIVVGPTPPLRRLWVTRGWSQASIAAVLGVSRTTVREWERGLSTPSWTTLRQLAAVLGADLAVVVSAAGRTLPRELVVQEWRSGMLTRVLVVLREWSGLTQSALAELLECSVATIRNWEHGRHIPSPDHRERLERLYRLPIGALQQAV